MQYPLYEFYSHSSLSLYDIREHFLEHFYYQRHSRKEAYDVRGIIDSSSKIGNILMVSRQKRKTPTYEDFLVTICTMWRFMFKSNETQALAVLDASIRWDREVNSMLGISTQEELKEETIKVFKKYSIYGEMTDEEYFPVATSTTDTTLTEESNDDQTTWSLMAFSHEFGKMQVKEFCRKDDGELFKACVFTKGRKKTYVGFSSKLGVLTPSEIEDMKNELIVIKSPSGNYNLYRRIGGGEDVNL